MSFVTFPRPKGRPRSKPRDLERRVADPATFFETLTGFASQDDCFTKLDDYLAAAPLDFRQNFHEWASMLELDDVQGWLLRESSWCGNAFRRNLPGGTWFVQETFRRRLKHLETRIDPRKLIDLWRWAVERPGVTAEIKSLWDSRAGQLRSTFVPPDRINTIPAQEKDFATLLREVAIELAGTNTARNEFGWAIDVLQRLAQERHPDEFPVRAASARVVFARDGDGKPNRYLRPGILIPFEFRQKPVRWLASRIDWLTSEEWFDDHFVEAMGSLMEEQSDCFPMSVLRTGLPPLPPGILTGSSGKFAVGMSQALANPRTRGDSAHAIPPWVAVTATARREGGVVAAPVGLFDEKLRTLIQEGVRVIVPAASQGKVSVPGFADGLIEILPQDGTYAKAAESLRTRNYTWPADLRKLRPGLTRRQMLTAVAITVGAAGACVALGRFTPHIHDVTPTPAMNSLEYRRGELEELRQKCLQAAKDLADTPIQSRNSDLTRLEALCRLAGRYNPEVLEPGRRPPEVEHIEANVETIARHAAFDCSEWQALSSESDIQEKPIEASLSTTIRRFRRKKEGQFPIVFEMNSSGFGVVPLLQPGDRLVLGTKLMDEGGSTKTSYVIRMIPAGGPSEFEESFHSIYFNGFQDQEVRRKGSDWCAIRVNPNAP